MKMGKWIKPIVAVLAMALGAVAQADPIRIAEIPSDAQWVIHVDVDGLQQSPAWIWMQAKLQDNQPFQAKIREMETVSASRFPQDLHSVTLYGRDFDEVGVTVLIHADADVKQILGLLKQNERYDLIRVGKYEIFTWEDQGKQLYGCFYASDRLVMGWSKDNVVTVLGLIGGKLPSLRADSPLAGGFVNRSAPLVYLAGSGLATLRHQGMARSPLLEHMKAAWVWLGTDSSNAAVHATIQAESPEVADQVRRWAEGLKAFATLGGESSKADAPTRALAAIAGQAEVTTKDTSVVLDWKIPLELAQQWMQGGAAGAGPSTGRVSSGLPPAK